MKRTNIWLRTDQLLKLKRISGKTGAPVGALVRKAIDAFLKKAK